MDFVTFILVFPFQSIPRIFLLIIHIPTLIFRIPTLTPRILTLIPRILNLIPCIPTLIPHIPTLVPRIYIIPFIPFPDFPFRFLQIVFYYRFAKSKAKLEI